MNEGGQVPSKNADNSKEIECGNVEKQTALGQSVEIEIKKTKVQPLISEVAKKMRMSSNLAKRKRPEDETAHPEDDWHGEVYSNASSYVLYDKFGQGVIATFSKGPVSSVLKGGHIASNSNVLCKVKPLSCFDDISGSTEIAQCEKGLETNKTIGVEISGTSQIVGKDLNLHIAELSNPKSVVAPVNARHGLTI